MCGYHSIPAYDNTRFTNFPELSFGPDAKAPAAMKGDSAWSRDDEIQVGDLTENEAALTPAHPVTEGSETGLASRR